MLPGLPVRLLIAHAGVDAPLSVAGHVGHAPADLDLRPALDQLVLIVAKPESLAHGYPSLAELCESRPYSNAG